jgi:hypothetical protein
MIPYDWAGQRGVVADKVPSQSSIASMSFRVPKFLPLLLGIVAPLLAAAVPAAAQDAWVADEFEARITLPDPEPGSPVTGGTMSCAEQVWKLSLATTIDAIVAGANGTAEIGLFLGTFPAPSKAVPAGIEITVPKEVLEPLKRGTRLVVGFDGGTDEVRFRLAGSRRAITAAEALCSQRRMPVANSVPLTPYSSYLLLAKALRESDIADFATSTAAEPRLRAGMVEIGGGRRLLFTELCGSTWYYGNSGCSLIGYAPADGKDPQTPEGWRKVYDTEGVFLYVDPETSSGGWPDLLAYSATEAGEPARWTWNGSEYVLADAPLRAQGSD